MEKIEISKIFENPNNPRVIKDEKFKLLVKSLQEAPWMLDIRPIAINAQGKVLGGNMRLKAAKEAGLKKVPIIRCEDLTEAQQDEFIIKDNLGYGEWDWQELANEWDVDKLAEWGLNVPDFKLPEDNLMGQELVKKFEVVVDCVDEKEQERVFNFIKEKGYTCRILTI